MLCLEIHGRRSGNFVGISMFLTGDDRSEDPCRLVDDGPRHEATSDPSPSQQSLLPPGVTSSFEEAVHQQQLFPKFRNLGQLQLDRHSHEQKQAFTGSG